MHTRMCHVQMSHLKADAAAAETRATKAELELAVLRTKLAVLTQVVAQGAAKGGLHSW